MKRVLIYGMNYAPELVGVGRFSGELGAYLAQQGVQVEVVTTPPHYPLWEAKRPYRSWCYVTERREGTRITRCPLLLHREMRGLRRLLAPLSFALSSAPIALWRILVGRPDVVLVVEPTLFAAPIALIAAKLIAARTVLHVQDLEVDAAFAVGHLRSGRLQRLAHYAEGKILRAFDHVITISNAMRKRLESKGVGATRLSLVRNWVDLQKIRPLDGPNSFRKELGLSDAKFVVLYAGNIGPKQGLRVMLEAAVQLQSDARVLFVLAGDGPEKALLESSYRHLANVCFLPMQPEERICELLSFADLHLLPQNAGAADLVLPSKLGGMLASGRPILVTTNPGTELYEFLAGAALIVSSGDSNAVAQMVLAASRDGQIAQKHSRHLAVAFAAQQALPKFAAILNDHCNLAAGHAR